MKSVFKNFLLFSLLAITQSTLASDTISSADAQLVAQAKIIAHLVSIAENGGLTTEQINAELRKIVEETIIDEIWVTDEKGHAYLNSSDGISFTFSADPKEQPQASVFYPLLTGEKSVVVQKPQKREIDDKIFQYIGVAGVDKPRIVQVGQQAKK